MKNFCVVVNGTSYDVAVDELKEPVTDSKPVQAAASQPSTSQSSASPLGAYNVPSPLPGVVLDIKVSVGDTVQKNQTVIILEAMKMENEIVTPVGGKVASIKVSKGDTINAGDTIVSIMQ